MDIRLFSGGRLCIYLFIFYFVTLITCFSQSGLSLGHLVDQERVARTLGLLVLTCSVTSCESFLLSVFTRENWGNIYFRRMLNFWDFWPAGVRDERCWTWCGGCSFVWVEAVLMAGEGRQRCTAVWEHMEMGTILLFHWDDAWYRGVLAHSRASSLCWWWELAASPVDFWFVTGKKNTKGILC